MSNDIQLDNIGTRRVLAALVEQATADLKRKSEKDNALRFFMSDAFSVIAVALRLNERRCRAEVQRIYNGKPKDDRTKESKGWARATGPRKHRLEEVSGELRSDIQEGQEG